MDFNGKVMIMAKDLRRILFSDKPTWKMAGFGFSYHLQVALGQWISLVPMCFYWETI